MSAGTAAPPRTRLDIGAVQAALAADGLDGWLLYDFHGLNPIAGALAGTRRSGHLATRRWFYLIPVSGSPRALVHAIEADTLSHLPGLTERYTGRDALEAGLRTVLTGLRRVAMEYSPGCAIPYIARVDAGTVELVRQCGVEVVSSGDLIQRFSAVWSADAVQTHRQASDALYRVKDRAFEAIAHRLRDGVRTTEYDIQQLMVGWFADEGLVSDSEPMVSVGPNAGNPHYLPTKTVHRLIEPGDLVLLDLWGKLQQSGAVYADITWVGVTRRPPSDEEARAFEAVRSARDAAVRLVVDAARGGRDLRGFEVDRVASAVLRQAGFGANILHRTGHSLGEDVHGTGVNMDDFETHDDRRLLPGTGFTIEPGVYFERFGIRSEINMIVEARDATVSGPLQTELVAVN
jgi:Xaa-Pro dipeptidase